MNITIRGGESTGVSLFEYIQIQKQEVPPVGRHTDSGVFQFDGHTYCLVGKLGKDILMHVPSNHVAIFNLKSQTVRQVALATLVVPVKAELVVYDPFSNAPECR